jgi:hypothetical protein
VQLARLVLISAPVEPTKRTIFDFNDSPPSIYFVVENVPNLVREVDLPRLEVLTIEHPVAIPGAVSFLFEEIPTVTT